MSLSLICPNCGAEVGIVEHGKETYFYKNESTGHPDCNNCHAEDAIIMNKKIYIGGIIIIIIILTIIFI